MARARACRQDRARGIVRRDIRSGAWRAFGVAVAAAAGHRGADLFRSADRLARADRLCQRSRPEDRRPCAGIVRARPPPGDCRRPGAARDRALVTGAAGGADHTRLTWILARQLRRRTQRDARTLPQTSMARGSDRGRADAACEAKKDVSFAAARSWG